MSVANPANLKEIQNLKQKFIVFCASRVPQTQRLYIGSSDFKVYEIDLAAEKPQRFKPNIPRTGFYQENDDLTAVQQLLGQ